MRRRQAGVRRNDAAARESALMDALLQLALDFSVLSLLAVGGAPTVFPEMQRSVVEVHGWMSASQFADLYAIAQASPGPNILVVTLIGWKVAGLAGALTATLAMVVPSCVLTCLVAGAWERFREARWRAVVQLGVAPLTVGLMLSSGYLLTRSADHTVAAFVLTAVTAGLLLSTRVNPLWLIAAGALAGLAGLV
jgi:chromate transporter